MCGCLIALVGAVAPRIAFVLLWFFTDLVSAAYDGLLIPLLGVILMPYTALVYAFVAPDGLSLINVIFLIVAVIVDIGAWGGGEYTRRAR
jgi:hypothetical protein